MLQEYRKAIKAEFIKSRRQKTWLTILITAGIVPIIGFIESFFDNQPQFFKPQFPTNFFNAASPYSEAFSSVFLTMGIVLLAAQICSTEHKNNTWQLVETQPISKFNIFIAKYTKLLFHVICLIVLFFLLVILERIAVFYISNLQSQNYYLDIEIGKIFQIALNMLFASMSFIAMIFALHFNIKKTNLITTIALIFVLGYHITKVFQVYFHPLIPLVQIDRAAGKISEIGEWITFYSRLSFIQSIFILCIGYYFYNYKYHSGYFFKQPKALLKIAGISILGSILCVWMQTPKIQKSYGSSVIAGKIAMDIPIDKITLFDINSNPIMDITIRPDSTFHINFDSIPLPKYHYTFGIAKDRIMFENNNSNRSSTFLSNGDSIFVDIKLINNNTSIAFSGNRLAESDFGTNQFDKLNKARYYITNEERPMAADMCIILLDDAIKKDQQTIVRKTTIDGFQLSKDIQQQNTLLLYLSAYEVWQNFKMKQASNDSVLTDPPFIKNIEQQIRLDDISLIQFDAYKAYIYHKLNNNKEQVKDINRLNLVKQLPASPIKEAMYVDAAIKILNNQAIEDSTAIKMAYSTRELVQQKSLITQLNNAINTRTAKTRKDALPDFQFMDEDGKAQSLQQYLGKFIVIDVWASWCLPCLYNAPYFSDFADKYKEKNVQFVSISTDKNIRAWKSKKSTNPHIVNWITDSNQPFMNYFAVQSIPRFILISPEGKPLNHELPLPGSKNFESILNQYIK